MIEAFELRPDGFWWGPPIGVGEVLDYTLDFGGVLVADPTQVIDPLQSVDWTVSDGISMDEDKNAFGDTYATVWLHSPDPAKSPYTITCDVTAISGRSAVRAFKLDLRRSPLVVFVAQMIIAAALSVTGALDIQGA